MVLATPLTATCIALILAVGSTDKHIHVFTRSENTVCHGLVCINTMAAELSLSLFHRQRYPVTKTGSAP
jgi:hypothetical protein